MRCALLLLLATTVADAGEFILTPLICVQQKNHPCVIDLKVRWQQDKPACLYQPPAPEPLLCGDVQLQQELPLSLDKDSKFELRTQDAGRRLLAERQIRVLTIDVNAGDKMLKRSRWGTQ